MQNSRIRILKWAEKVAFWEMGSWIDFEGPVDLTGSADHFT